MLGTEVNREETKEEGRRAIKRSSEGSKGRGTSDDRCGWRVRGVRRVYVYDLKHKNIRWSSLGYQDGWGDREMLWRAVPGEGAAEGKARAGEGRWDLLGRGDERTDDVSGRGKGDVPGKVRADGSVGANWAGREASTCAELLVRDRIQLFITVRWTRPGHRCSPPSPLLHNIHHVSLSPRHTDSLPRPCGPHRKHHTQAWFPLALYPLPRQSP